MPLITARAHTPAKRKTTTKKERKKQKPCPNSGREETVDINRFVFSFKQYRQFGFGRHL